MGMGSGGFFVARDMFKQAAGATRPDNSSAMLFLFAFAALLAMLGPGGTVAACSS